MIPSRSFPALLLLGALAGCAGPGSVVPQQTTIAEVRARMGTPTDIRFDRNGEELWEYARGPAGTETYLIRFDKDGRVRSITQLLTQEQFARIVPNKTTKAQARELLGRPSDQSFLRTGTAWSWRVLVGPQLGYFVVRFNRADIVEEAMLLIDISPDDRDRRDRRDGGDRGDRGGRN